MDRISFLEQMLGTRTKIKILKVLVNEKGPITRNGLVTFTGSGIGPVYEQTDELIALGALLEKDGKIIMDEDFPFLDQLRDMILLTEDHMNDRQTILRSIERILGNDYYITGYAGGCQNGLPLDIDERCLLIMIKGLNKRRDRMLNAISKCTDHIINWKDVTRIPEDVKRTVLFGVEVWSSSIERALIDSIVERECDHYPIFLLLVQNIVNNSIDIPKLIGYAGEQKIDDIIGQALMIISNRIEDVGKWTHDIVETDLEIERSVKFALNTVLG